MSENTVNLALHRMGSGADEMVAPMQLLAKALGEAHRHFPSVSVNLVVATPQAALDAIKSGEAHVGALSAQPLVAAEVRTAH